jgi:hypothetical protein
LDALFVALQDLNCLFLGAGDISLPPAAGTAAVAVLDEQVAAADFAFAFARGIGTGSRGVVLRHVDLKFLGIGAGRRFPARFFCVGVEVVRKVLGVRMTNFPCIGETGVSLPSR